MNQILNSKTGYVTSCLLRRSTTMMSVSLCLLLSLSVQAKTTSNAKANEKISIVEHTTQQEKVITGVVTDKATGETIIGANVIVKGTTNGVITDFDGKFSIDAPENAIIQFSYIGYATQELPVKGKSVFNVILSEDTQALEEVVVTAMGIERKSKSLTYATQQVGGKEFTRAKETNRWFSDYAQCFWCRRII